MRESDVLVMPSLFESFGLVFLEAMAQGTIPIAPDWEVQREIVDYGRAGIITSGNAEEIALKLEQLFDDADLRIRLATSAKLRFLRRFSAPIVADKYASVFKRCGSAEDQHFVAHKARNGAG